MVNNKQKKKNITNKKSSESLPLNQVFPTIDDWPESWAGDKNDIPVGKIILKEFKIFLHEQQSRLTKNTLKDYGNYLWALGGEIIRDTNCSEIKEKDLKDDFLLSYVSECGGPDWRHATSESDLERYHSICRRFYKYLINKSK
jgi:hypothetical protein